jgi:hypothetical protein
MFNVGDKIIYKGYPCVVRNVPINPNGRYVLNFEEKVSLRVGSSRDKIWWCSENHVHQHATYGNCTPKKYIKKHKIT